MRLFKGRKNSVRHNILRIFTYFYGNYPPRLPDFFVVGATRCGSTTLNRILNAHPEVFVPPGRELEYFNNDALFQENLNGYRQMFSGYKGEKFIGEVTPSYFDQGAIFDKYGVLKTGQKYDAIARIASSLPNAKIIISLRDPIDRIKSIYKKNFNQGKISHSLEEELQNERNGSSRLRLIRRSKYADDIKNILYYFPKENIKIMIFEEWTNDQINSMKNLFLFIGADANFRLSPVESNSSERYRKHNDHRILDLEISTETRKYVIDATSQSRIWLESFLGKELPWMKK